MILGIDEVGRGPLAGPLVVGAVILPEERPDWVAQLKDSKKLSCKKREILNAVICENAPAYGLGWVKVGELNEIGLMEGLRLATRRAVEEIQKNYQRFTEIIIDGNINFLKDTPLESYTTTLIKGDDKVKEISAASIIAKVARDRYMINLASKYPEYGFDKHMGYGTNQHLEAIRRCGICEEHRLFFEPCKSISGFQPAYQTKKKNTTVIGNKGEETVRKYLVSRGHRIVTNNFKTKICEIDIISIKDDTIYFTEVKTRKNDLCGGGLAAVDQRKLEKMKFAVEVFLKTRTEYRNYNPMLAVAGVNGDYEVLSWEPIRS